MKYIKINELKKNPNNPRIIKDEGFKKLKASLKSKRGKDHFEARPCIVSTRTGENIIIAGNTRYQAAKDLGWEEVPTVIINNLTEAEEQEILVRDNVTNGDWDYDVLLTDFDSDDLGKWGVDLPNFSGEPPAILDGASKNKDLVIKCTFKTLEDLENAKVEIQEIMDRYAGSYMSVSGGEL